MCIYIRYSMSIIKKVFHYEENKISVIKCNDEIWFRGKSVAQSLGYLKPLKALPNHVDKEDKRKLSNLEDVPQNGVHLRLGVTQNGVHLNLQSSAQSLGYLKPLKALDTHVDKEDKRKLSNLEGVPQNGVHLRLGLTQNGVHLNLQSGCLFINESGLCSFILRLKLESAKEFKRWVTKDVLPSIRKTGRYDYCIDHKYNNMLTFKIENEMDLYF